LDLLEVLLKQQSSHITLKEKMAEMQCTTLWLDLLLAQPSLLCGALKVIKDLVCTSQVLQLFWWSRGGHARQEEEEEERWAT
jgi:hypothetical protein